MARNSRIRNRRRIGAEQLCRLETKFSGVEATALPAHGDGHRRSRERPQKGERNRLVPGQ